jgi:SAM-dependent methyltransferase
MKPGTTYRKPNDHVYLDASITDHHHKAILKRLMAGFGIKPGDRVLEVGAGSGRYTQALLSLGYKVVATEPSDALITKLRQRLPEREDLEVHQVTSEDILPVAQDVRLVCGFHVLHHIDRERLALLGSALAHLWSSLPAFGGWFFLEPNPNCPLWPLSILTTSATSFTEERGVWRWGCYDETLGTGEDRSTLLGSVGLYPPKPFVAKLPEWVQERGVCLKPLRDPLHIYAIYGRRRKGTRG